jgi:hypothetical protein
MIRTYNSVWRSRQPRRTKNRMSDSNRLTTYIVKIPHRRITSQGVQPLVANTDLKSKWTQMIKPITKLS